MEAMGAGRVVVATDVGDTSLLLGPAESPSGVLFAPSDKALADAIAAVQGIDALLIGTSDLSAELGISGQIGHARVAEAYEKVGTACRAHGKALGMGGVYDKDNASRYIEGGARMILSGSDHNYILAGAKARTEILRAAV